jgi:hypothetical protein
MRYILALAMVITLFSSCKKETSLQLKKVEFIVNTTDWYPLGNLFGFEKAVPELTSEVLADANISAFYSPNPNNGWSPLPSVRQPGLASVAISFAPSQASIGYYDLDLTTEAPTSPLYFKLVITNK